MSSDALGAIVDRLIQKFGKAGVEQLKTATFTREQLLSPSLDPDRYAFLVATRSEEVEAVLNAAQTSVQAAADAAATSLRKFYEGIRSGVNTPEVVALWLKTNFAQDFEQFRASFPQTAPSESIWNTNIAQITALVAPRFVAPNYHELVRSYEDAINPPDGSMPKLHVLCPDGQIRTGKALQDAVRQWSIELLEPVKVKAAPVQSADEFLRDHPELKDTRPPGLLVERFHKEFARFLQSDVGRAWHKRMSEYGHLEQSILRLDEYMTQHGLELTQKGFEIGAVAVSDEISVTLDQGDIGGARYKNTFIHDAGGNRARQIPMGGEGGMAGQYHPNQFNPDKVWSEAAVRHELARLSAHELKERFADKAFVEALNKYGL
jgi:hypothetical protein